MNWSYKFGFDEIDALLEKARERGLQSEPWLIVGDQFARQPASQQDAFLSMQRELMQEFGWDWFRTAVRGRFFPDLGLTTVTTWDGERDPSIGDPEREVMARVEKQFPGAAIVSLIGAAHAIKGDVSPKILEILNSATIAQTWQQAFKTAEYVGDRYPGHSILPIDVSWNRDESSKDIVQEGTSRQRMLRYKQASCQWRYAMDEESNTWLVDLIGKHWAISIPAATGFLIWFATATGNPSGLPSQTATELGTSIQQGATPQAVMRQVDAENLPQTSPETEGLGVQVQNVPASQLPEENPQLATENDLGAVDIGQWVDKIIQTESGGDTQATSPKGARGVMQLMPATWNEWTEKVYGRVLPFDQAYNPEINKRVGIAYLGWVQNTLRSWMKEEPTIAHILAAYNGGVGRLRQRGYDVWNMPEETVNYVQKITGQQKSGITTIRRYRYAFKN